MPIGESTPDPWARFARDPRDPSVVALRATDADRAVIADLLTDAYADGRLSRDELDERSEAAAAVRAYGEVVPVLEDLIPTSGPPPPALATPAPVDAEAQAVRAYERMRRDAWVTSATVTLICVAIWLAVGPGFPWPLIVAAATLAHAVETTLNRDKYLDKERSKVERRRRKELERRRSRELDRGDRGDRDDRDDD